MLNFAGTIFKLIFPLLHLKKDRAVKFAKTTVTPIFLIVTTGVLWLETAHTLPETAKITIYYDARKEFHSSALLSTIIAQVQAHHDSYSAYNNQTVRMPITIDIDKPQCRSSDQICAQYVAYIDSQTDKIMDALRKRGDLFTERDSIQAQIDIHDNNIALIVKDNQQELKLQEKLRELMTFVEAVMDNQEINEKILIDFERYMFDAENENAELDERIAEIRSWIRVKDTDGSYKAFEDFVNNVEEVYKIIKEKDSPLLLSHLHTLFMNYNPDILKIS